MNSRVTIKKTDDGSTTLFVPELDEHYHSIYGAVNESLHVFVKAGLKQLKKDVIRVFEVGYGTGLNAYLTYLHKEDKKIEYYAVEKYPIDNDLISQIKFGDAIEECGVFVGLHNAIWDEPVKINNAFKIVKFHADLRDLQLKDARFDLVYFDAFAPDKHPDLWTKQVFEKMFSWLLPGGYLVTYCAKGVVRRMMQEIGFVVERLPGPPPKKEMLRAQKPMK
ncbi:MAG: tRNA (5-methylaminomethyl-2-thiouridine)(34)-methyltransferase MnmD [Marinilabiliaceae bacterium]|nr:tRNA (5-methylaminomethyl-2-thiouridine)(34)-methyltransferase MnmD [Marinilabiliaceae bacterium]